jgi:hypothetical protein
VFLIGFEPKYSSYGLFITLLGIPVYFYLQRK